MAKNVKIVPFSAIIQSAGESVTISDSYLKDYTKVTGIALSVPQPETITKVAKIEFDSNSEKIFDKDCKADIVAFTLNNPPNNRFFHLHEYELEAANATFSFSFKDGSAANTQYPYMITLYLKQEK